MEERVRGRVGERGRERDGNGEGRGGMKKVGERICVEEGNESKKNEISSFSDPTTCPCTSTC